MKIKCPNCKFEGENPNANKAGAWGMIGILSIIGIVGLPIAFLFKFLSFPKGTGGDFMLFFMFLILPALFGTAKVLTNKYSNCPKCGFKNIVKE